LEPLSYLVFVIVFAIEYKRTRRVLYLSLLVYYLAACSIIFPASVIAFDPKGNNNTLYNIHYIVSIVFLSFYFVAIINIPRFTRFAVIGTLAVTSVILFGWLRSPDVFNSLGCSVFFLLAVLYCFIYLRQLLKDPGEERIMAKFDFWYVSGSFLYFSGGFCIVASYKHLTAIIPEAQQSMLANIWSLQNILLFISSMVTIYGLIWTGYTKQLR